MGTDHKKIILTQLAQWRSLALQQGKSLSEDNLEEFERLTAASAKIQARLDEIFSALKPAKIDRESLSLLQEIRSLQADLIVQLKKGSQELSDVVGNLRKNMTSLQGYRQTGTSGPRFMNERT